MEKFYYINNGKKPYTIDDFLNERKLLFKDDKIWFEGLTDWVKVDEIEELKRFARTSPPLSKSQRRLKQALNTFAKAFIFYFIFSVIIGVFAGLLEKSQFKTFFAEKK